jgi:hypothetical protein
MKKLFSVMAMAMLILSVMPIVLGTDVGVGVGIEIITEDYAPNIWMCDSRAVTDDNTQPGRDGVAGAALSERGNNYAFEGEQIAYTVLVKDKNGIQKISDVFGTLGDVQGAGNDIEVNCVEDIGFSSTVEASCNARISEESLTGDTIDSTMRYYSCIFTVETADSHYGEYWYTVEVEDLDGLSNTIDENEYWYLNPTIALSIDGDLTFDDVRPGTSSYSSTLLVGNDADDGSGVLLDMFISGTDFYDSASSGAACPTTNQLLLGNGDSVCDATDNFCYFASSGAFSTETDARADAEGYVGINYATGFNNPSSFYDVASSNDGSGEGFELIQSSVGTGPGDIYFSGNILTPGSEAAVTFRLNLPEPCNGDFDTGSLSFWGEAI